MPNYFPAPKGASPETTEGIDGTDNEGEASGADTDYEAALQQYVRALQRAIDFSHKAAGYRATNRQYWASVLFTRLCCTGRSVLYLCPGSPVNRDGSDWDFSSLAPLARNLFKNAAMLFYLGSEVATEAEEQARILVIQLKDCTERLLLFQHLPSCNDTVLAFQKAGKDLRARLVKNSHFTALPQWRRKSLMRGDTATILTEDEILKRMGTDEATRAYVDFLTSHTELSPLTYYRTGDQNRGRGDENEVDKGHMASALAFARDVLSRATEQMRSLFQDLLAQQASEPTTAKRDDHVEHLKDQVLQWEGGFLEAFTGTDDLGAPLLCSHCLHDEGLRLTATHIGFRSLSRCPNCGGTQGRKLDKRALELLAHQFFVWGTIRRCDYGGYPAVQFNAHQPTSIGVPSWLEPDLRLIEKALGVGFFDYGPRLWMVGEVEPLKSLQEPGTRAGIVSRILNEYPGRLLGTDERFYRLRKAPARPHEFDEYDSPPAESVRGGRLDSIGLPILYGSQDIEVCVHECRVTAEDESYLATLAPTKRLRLLNLAEPLSEEGVSEFDSLDIAVHMLFLAGSYSYDISREIARTAHEAGFDGLVYPSYFTLLRTGEMPFATTYGLSHRRFPQLRDHMRRNTISNLALFGRPVEDGSVCVKCINRVVLNRVEYSLHFGPTFREAAVRSDDE